MCNNISISVTLGLFQFNSILYLESYRRSFDLTMYVQYEFEQFSILFYKKLKTNSCNQLIINGNLYALFQIPHIFQMSQMMCFRFRKLENGKYCTSQHNTSSLVKKIQKEEKNISILYGMTLLNSQKYTETYAVMVFSFNFKRIKLSTHISQINYRVQQR